MEVETPILSQAGNSDPHIESFTSDYDGTGMGESSALYLHTSPEYAMKRLLAAGIGDIFQIAKVFRQGELGRYHNPEFTMLEWYRIGFTMQELIDEVSELLSMVVAKPAFKSRPQIYPYCQLFQERLGIDPLQTTPSELSITAIKSGLDVVRAEMIGKNEWLDLLFATQIQPQLGHGEVAVVTDYPADQAALAKLKGSDPQVAERFEIFIDGIELANGYAELCDHQELEVRLNQELKQRRIEGKVESPIDHHFLAATQAGIPDVSGVAVGLDRLLMLALGRGRLDEVISFSFNRS